MADPKRGGYAPPVVEDKYANNSEIAESLQSGSFNWSKVPTFPETEPIPIGYVAVAPDDLAELKRKAAMWDAHEAHQGAIQNADAEFWAKITSIKEGFGI